MQHSILITEERLNSQADFTSFRNLFPELLFKLISASIKNPFELRVPSGGSIGQPGWDGIVYSPYAFQQYVPEGQSFWEFSTSNDPKKEANANFNKRTQQTRETDMRSSIFVFVTPRSAVSGWSVEEQRQWIWEQRKNSKWKDVRVLDATKLSHWLCLFPSIDCWLANQFGISTKGLSFPCLHWENLKRYGSPPDLKPEVFLIGREEAIKQLLRIFQGETLELLLETRYPEEGVDFVAAMLASLKLEQEAAFTGRCLIIDSPETWNDMCALQNPHIMVATPSLDLLSTGASLRLQARNKGHGVIFAGIPVAGAHGNSVRLSEIKQYDMEKTLVSSGYSTEKARMVSNKCGGRIIVLKRLLLDISASPDWASTNIASELAIATLIGQWNGNFDGDRETIEGILGKPYGEWLGKIRPMTLRPDPPLIQRDEKWRFVSRYEGWQSLGQYLFNNDLDKFQKQALIVLAEKDPKFTLPSDERWKASVYGKNPKYSEAIRKGFAETLALLGSHPEALSSCSVGKPESIASVTVREILREADWIQLASLNSILPLFAEAAPEQFLAVIENMLNDSKKTVFRDIFFQESSGLMGENYMTGVLWSLETLSWHQDYLARVTVILGRLAEMDPGGNWTNRPLNSLVTIFLPWLPQTCASVEIRKIAIESLIKECQHVAWKLLLELLPSSHQTSSGTCKPIWRDFIPSNRSEKVSNKEYIEQVTIYASLAIQCATIDLKKLLEIIGYLDNLPLSARAEILKYLSSENVQDLPNETKVNLWEALIDVVIKHRKFADAQWAMAKEEVDKIAQVSEGLRPSTPQLIHRRLFREAEFELIEEKENYEEQSRKLGERRAIAIQEILDSYGIEGMLDFASSITDTQQVGIALGQIATDEYDSVLLPKFLVHQDKQKQSLVVGYVWSRFKKNGWQWVDRINTQGWLDEEKSTFLAVLPFEPETWHRAMSILKGKESLYWKKADARPYHLKDALPRAVENLLKYGRPMAAIQCLYWMIQEKMQISVVQAHRALIDNLSSEELHYSMDQHACIETIKWLQDNTETEDDILFQVEWGYLLLLKHHYGIAPKTLERHLAEDPHFFSEVIKTVFQSDKEKMPTEDISEKRKRIVSNAYRLLHEWRTPPGTMRDGSFDGTTLRNWINEVKQLCDASGHLRFALDQVGKVLAHSPADLSGLWINKNTAEVLNDVRHDVMRTAFKTEFYNQRGVFTWTAGQEERILASQYRQKALALEKEGYFRFAALMRDLAVLYERDADQEATEDPYDI